MDVQSRTGGQFYQSLLYLPFGVREIWGLHHSVDLASLSNHQKFIFSRTETSVRVVSNNTTENLKYGVQDLDPT